jgi:predicted nucleotidyltransferase
MKIAAIVAEYNPFHQGHAWQVQTIRQRLGDDCAILAVMSGCFTQRGEPAIFDKWARTLAALSLGVDLVIELPFAYATASAERFAAGGVALVQATGLDCQLVFGSECGDLEPLSRLADLLSSEPPEFKKLLHQSLDQGESFPSARQQAVEALTGQPELAALLKESNNILAVEYLKAIKGLPAGRIQPLTLKRQGQAYRETSTVADIGGFASASAIRRVIEDSLGKTGRAPGWEPDLADLFQKLAPLVPDASFGILMEKAQSGPGPVFLEDLSQALLSQLRSQPVSDIEHCPGMGEGLAGRLAAAAGKPQQKPGGACSADRVSVLLGDSATRRFPQTRIRRALIAMLAGLTSDDYTLFDQAGGPRYIRILGFNRQGRHLLKIMRQIASLPVVMKGSDFLEHNEPAFVRMAALDVLATDLWMLAAGESCGRDFDTQVVMG